MKRSAVVDGVVLMPMKIKMQWDGDKLIVVMPGWQLPATGTILAEGDSVAEATEALREKMREYWNRSSNEQAHRAAESGSGGAQS